MATEKDNCARTKLAFNAIERINEQDDIMNCWFDDTEKLYHCVKADGSEWTSPLNSTQTEWKKVLPPTQQKIKDILEGMKDLLLYKNQKYGDSAINPKKIFYKGDSTNSILIRLDDKIGRVMSNTEEKPRVNDVADIIGYCTLLLISMGVTAEDIAKFKD